MHVIPRLTGLQYHVSKFLIARRVFRSGALVAVVDLDGHRASAYTESLLPNSDRIRLIPHAVLRYVGNARHVEARLMDEPVPPQVWDHDRFGIRHSTAYRWETKCLLLQDAPMTQLFEVVRELRLEEAASLPAEMYGAAIRSWHENVPFAGGEATVVELHNDRTADMATFFTACSGLQLSGAPDFMPVNSSSRDLLSVFHGMEFQEKERGIDVASFLIREAWQKLHA